MGRAAACALAAMSPPCTSLEPARPAQVLLAGAAAGCGEDALTVVAMASSDPVFANPGRAPPPPASSPFCSTPTSSYWSMKAARMLRGQLQRDAMMRVARAPGAAGAATWPDGDARARARAQAEARRGRGGAAALRVAARRPPDAAQRVPGVPAGAPSRGAALPGARARSHTRSAARRGQPLWSCATVLRPAAAGARARLRARRPRLPRDCFMLRWRGRPGAAAAWWGAGRAARAQGCHARVRLARSAAGGAGTAAAPRGRRQRPAAPLLGPAAGCPARAAGPGACAQTRMCARRWTGRRAAAGARSTTWRRARCAARPTSGGSWPASWPRWACRRAARRARRTRRTRCAARLSPACSRTPRRPCPVVRARARPRPGLPASVPALLCCGRSAVICTLR